MPVSLVPQPDGSTLPFPHFYERGKPGYIAIDPAGRRFTNESASYHDFVPAMVEACRGGAETMSWLLTDHRAIRRYGIDCNLRWGYIHGAVRKGRWKLYLDLWKGFQKLFDLEKDPGEKNDLSAAEPQVFAEMKALYDAWDKSLPRHTSRSPSTIAHIRWRASLQRRTAAQWQRLQRRC